MKQFSKILCVVDPEKTMDTTIRQSITIAENHQADITFMSVVKVSKFWRAAFQNKEEYAKDLDKLVENRRSAIEGKIASIPPSMKTDIVVTSGIAFIDVIKHAIQHQHDLVIKCAEDIDWMDRMLGSEDMHLLRKCPCPILMLKPEQEGGFSNILATVDVSDNIDESDEGRVQEQLNEQVLAYGAALSTSEIHVGSAWEAYGEDLLRHSAFTCQPEEAIDEYVEQEHRKCFVKLDKLVRDMNHTLESAEAEPLKPRLHLIKGTASKEIPQMVEQHDIDLIVMGTVGRVGVPGLIIGNTAESILEQTKCSVLAIKPKGFSTPVE